MQYLPTLRLYIFLIPFSKSDWICFHIFPLYHFYLHVPGRSFILDLFYTLDTLPYRSTLLYASTYSLFLLF